MKTVWAWLDVLLHPPCWIQIHPYSARWESELSRLLDAGEPFMPYKAYDFFQAPSEYEARLGPYLVWLRNHPYGSFSNGNWRPRRATVLRAGRILARTWPTPVKTWVPVRADGKLAADGTTTP